MYYQKANTNHSRTLSDNDDEEFCSPKPSTSRQISSVVKVVHNNKQKHEDDAEANLSVWGTSHLDYADAERDNFTAKYRRFSGHNDNYEWPNRESDFYILNY